MHREPDAAIGQRVMGIPFDSDDGDGSSSSDSDCDLLHDAASHDSAASSDVELLDYPSDPDDELTRDVSVITISSDGTVTCDGAPSDDVAPEPQTESQCAANSAWRSQAYYETELLRLPVRGVSPVQLDSDGDSIPDLISQEDIDTQSDGSLSAAGTASPVYSHFTGYRTVFVDEVDFYQKDLLCPYCSRVLLRGGEGTILREPDHLTLFCQCNIIIRPGRGSDAP